MADPFLGEIKMCSFNFAPKGWALCNGQFLPINQNQPLFALLGTMYGGNGQTTFALPDLRGPFPVGSGDAFLAGLTVAYGRGEPLVDAARLGMAAAIANAQMPGAGVLDPGSVDGILERVVAASV